MMLMIDYLRSRLDLHPYKTERVGNCGGWIWPAWRKLPFSSCFSSWEEITSVNPCWRFRYDYCCYVFLLFLPTESVLSIRTDYRKAIEALFGRALGTTQRNTSIETGREREREWVSSPSVLIGIISVPRIRNEFKEKEETAWIFGPILAFIWHDNSFRHRGCRQSPQRTDSEKKINCSLWISLSLLGSCLGSLHSPLRFNGLPLLLFSALPWTDSKPVLHPLIFPELCSRWKVF